MSRAELLRADGRGAAAHGRTIAGRTEHTATKLSDGRVLVIGHRDGVTRFHSTEIYERGHCGDRKLVWMTRWKWFVTSTVRVADHRRRRNSSS